MRSVRSLKIGVSGVRGIVGETLSPHLITTFSQAFGSLVGRGTVLVGRDTRVSGAMIEKAVVSGLLAVGCEPVRVGICPIPSLQIRTRHSNAVGSIAITASHNPVQWNALKFIGADGLFLSTNQAEELLDVYHQSEFALATNDEYMTVRDEAGAYGLHLAMLLAYFDVEAIRRSGRKVVYDCCNGAGSLMTPEFMERLGCDAMGINTAPNGMFPHDPEPVPENLGELCAKVRETGADIGFAQDADADRLAIVDEHGEPVGEDYTLAFAVEHILGKRRGVVVTHLSATRGIREIASKYESPVVYTKIGEINVVEGIIANNAVIGGEGNGGVIVPDLHPCRDSFAAMGIVLEHLAETGMTVSELRKTMPVYTILKDRQECSTERAHTVVRELVKRFSDLAITTIDGVKVDYPDSWIHIRPSNTEPILRLTAEARTVEEARRLLEEVKGEIRGILAAL